MLPSQHNTHLYRQSEASSLFLPLVALAALSLLDSLAPLSGYPRFCSNDPRPAHHSRHDPKPFARTFACSAASGRLSNSSNAVPFTSPLCPVLKFKLKKYMKQPHYCFAKSLSIIEVIGALGQCSRRRCTGIAIFMRTPIAGFDGPGRNSLPRNMVLQRLPPSRINSLPRAGCCKSIPLPIFEFIC